MFLDRRSAHLRLNGLMRTILPAIFLSAFAATLTPALAFKVTGDVFFSTGYQKELLADASDGETQLEFIGLAGGKITHVWFEQPKNEPPRMYFATVTLGRKKNICLAPYALNDSHRVLAKLFQWGLIEGLGFEASPAGNLSIHALQLKNGKTISNLELHRDLLPLFKREYGERSIKLDLLLWLMNFKKLGQQFYEQFHKQMEQENRTYVRYEEIETFLIENGGVSQP